MCGVCGCGSAIGSRGRRVAEARGRDVDVRYRPIADAPGQAPLDALSVPVAPTLDASAGAMQIPGVSPRRLLRIEKDILGHNDAIARTNRQRLTDAGILALNLVSSPGSGKTTLLVRTLGLLARRLPVVVVEGDQQTSLDAERIRATGVPAIQINTGKGCHLDARMVGEALDRLAPTPGSVVLIENVGNLVCPSSFDLGEAHKVVVLSVTEGEDKPLKYPDMFRAADLMLLNKCDLLPHLDFDVDLAIAHARRVNPAIRVIRTSARTGEGMDEWLGWIDAARARLGPADASTPEQRPLASGR